jgi:hypothetical protein
MNQIVSRYEYDKESMKLCLFNEKNENIVYISLYHHPYCGESFGMYIRNLDSKILNKRIKNIIVEEPSKNDEWKFMKNIFTITITMDDYNSIKVVLYNENGNYSHDVIIYYDNVNILDCV